MFLKQYKTLWMNLVDYHVIVLLPLLIRWSCVRVTHNPPIKLNNCITVSLLNLSDFS